MSATYIDAHSVISGAVAGALVRWAICRRQIRKALKHYQRLATGPAFPEDEAREAADRWATERGVREATPLILNKLRLGWHLSRRPPSRRRARWR